ncbi:MAG TPA: SsrA-binding protein SmpB [Anaerolineae bacterium]|nr:SsrA-binding protein SmpB [Anaerolineae bacterium]
MAEKNIAVNRKAYHDYSIEERYEAGLVLQGSEIKSIRDGRVSLREAFVSIRNGEAWLVNAHIAPYPMAGYAQHEARRDRKLLLHRKQIYELALSVQAKGYTIVPLRLYLSDGRAKIEIALARGKRQYDTRAALAEREARRTMERAVRRRAEEA